MLVLVLVLVPVLFSKWSRELRRCLSIYISISTYLPIYLYICTCLCICSLYPQWKGGAVSRSHNMFRTLLRYTSAYYPCLSKTCENSLPDEHAKNTPNQTHFRAVVTLNFLPPAYRTSQTISQVKVSQKEGSHKRQSLTEAREARPHRSQSLTEGKVSEGKVSQKARCVTHSRDSHKAWFHI